MYRDRQGPRIAHTQTKQNCFSVRVLPLKKVSCFCNPQHTDERARAGVQRSGILNVVASIHYSNNCLAVMSDPQTCVMCPQGCDTVDKSPDGVCPKFWQRPDGSLVCSQAWFCIPYASINQRIIGGCFFLIALIYIRIIYYNYKKTSTASPDVALRAPGSRSPILILFGGSSLAILQLCKPSYNFAVAEEGFFNRALSFLRKIPSRTIAR